MNDGLRVVNEAVGPEQRGRFVLRAFDCTRVPPSRALGTSHRAVGAGQAGLHEFIEDERVDPINTLEYSPREVGNRDDPQCVETIQRPYRPVLSFLNSFLS